MAAVTADRTETIFTAPQGRDHLQRQQSDPEKAGTPRATDLAPPEPHWHGHLSSSTRSSGIPRLSDDEYGQLEASLKESGCRDPLVAWEGHNVLLDGHHRHQIYEADGINFDVVSRPQRRDDLDPARSAQPRSESRISAAGQALQRDEEDQGRGWQVPTSTRRRLRAKLTLNQPQPNASLTRPASAKRP
jgi:hypothetical protein